MMERQVTPIIYDSDTYWEGRELVHNQARAINSLAVDNATKGSVREMLKNATAKTLTIAEALQQSTAIDPTDALSQGTMADPAEVAVLPIDDETRTKVVVLFRNAVSGTLTSFGAIYQRQLTNPAEIMGSLPKGYIASTSDFQTDKDGLWDLPQFFAEEAETPNLPSD